MIDHTPRTLCIVLLAFFGENLAAVNALLSFTPHSRIDQDFIFISASLAATTSRLWRIGKRCLIVFCLWLCVVCMVCITHRKPSGSHDMSSAVTSQARQVAAEHALLWYLTVRQDSGLYWALDSFVVCVEGELASREACYSTVFFFVVSILFKLSITWQWGNSIH